VNFDGLTDSVTRSALRLSWLEAALEPVSDYGRHSASSIVPFAPGEEMQAQQQAQTIVDAAQRLDASRIDAIRDALRFAPDAVPAIARAGMGGVLSDANFLELQRFLDAVSRIDALLDAGGFEFKVGNDATAQLSRALERGRAGKFGFYLADDFGPHLAKARAQAAQTQAEFDSARGRLASRVAERLHRAEISGNEFIVMRDALDGPLPPEVHVVREAPTYLLCELELDEGALRALARRDEAVDAVAQAEEEARASLSVMVRERARELQDVAHRLGEVDVLATRIRFVHYYDAIAPQISTDAVVECEDVSYLPLRAELEREDRRYEPISVRLNGVAVLTGPNMGGKSVALRTCGFVAVLAAFGLPVPAKSARIGLFEEISWLGIGGDDDGAGLLSSFAREVVRLRDLLERPLRRTLLLIDEFARTTTPHEGKALLVALVDALRKRGKLAFVATHLAGVAAASGARHFAVRGLRSVPKQRSVARDLNAALAALGDSMDYSIVEVTDGKERQADAIALAHLLGLDEEIVSLASHVLLDEAERQGA